MTHAVTFDGSGRERSRPVYGALDRLLAGYAARKSRARDRRTALVASEEANVLAQLRDRQVRHGHRGN